MLIRWKARSSSVVVWRDESWSQLLYRGNEKAYDAGQRGELCTVPFRTPQMDCHSDIIDVGDALHSVGLSSISAEGFLHSSYFLGSLLGSLHVGQSASRLLLFSP